MTTEATPTNRPQSGPPGGRPGGGAGGPRPGGRPGGRPRGRFVPRRRVCTFCVEHIKMIDYKDIEKIRRFVSDRAKIEPRRRSGVCAKHQRALRIAIQRARHIALIPFVAHHSFPSARR
jgi:small subunit ribosomal protein S18